MILFADVQNVHGTLDMSGTVISKSKGFGAGASLPGFAGACSRSIAIVACTGAVCNFARFINTVDMA